MTRSVQGQEQEEHDHDHPPENTIRLTPEDRRALAQIGNIPWRDWHYHLYTCRQCQTGTKCSRGQDLFTIAQDQPRPTT